MTTTYRITDRRDLDTYHRVRAERGPRCDSCGKPAKYQRQVGLWENGGITLLTESLCGIHKRGRDLPWWFRWGSVPVDARELLEAKYTPIKPIEEATVPPSAHPLQAAIDVCPTEEEAALVWATPFLLSELKEAVRIIYSRDKLWGELTTDLARMRRIIALAEGKATP